MARDRTPQHATSGDVDHRPPPNLHSRGAAREQIRQQQPGGAGVLADLHTLHGQRNRDIHTVFVSTPRESVATSAYVSGHLTPTDQWVAVSSSGSGVISLTSSDNEDEGRILTKGKAPAPAPALHVADPQQLRRRGYFSAMPVAAPVPKNNTLPTAPGSSRLGSEQQAVHLLRESVASLLSSTGSAASSTVSSAQPQSLTVVAATAPERGDSWRRRSQSPSSVSKISEPCYAASAPRRQFTADLDHFSDIALSAVAVTAPPSHQRSQRPESSPHSAARLPTYDEFKHRGAVQPPLYDKFKHRETTQPSLYDAEVPDVYMPPTIQPSSFRRIVPAVDPSAFEASVAAESRNSSTSSLRRRVAGSGGMSGSSAAATTVVASTAAPEPAPYHPLLSDLGSPRALHDQLSIYSASRSPFSSIRTVSPIIVAEGNSILRSAAAIDEGAVARARAEAALERTILCPMSCTADNSYFKSEKETGTENPHSESDGANHSRQTWVKYTGYAIVGFGVGTLVGMMCFDMATSAVATPKATRTIPLAGF
ncbi:hypothetical protein COEREDRAFT_90262 [Coemansia reversa NRRL 1564]|uniref:Uncharacterized protein n=1 Tax=Coemansia reversa (strain ATCC 12441 / NRRL 1564) TaxID=763665 RepID=A0A2G5BKJ0_COERN|nr:hypothetical protein COEREDRAFT_90262 [Coemansia reversa NRRL 1564]|eukprot:PIA19525.1 hypothetical protein COEREDRAFT_90262 [Coemansia reversa NRRL 1564]